MTLLLVSFIAGALTVLAPCILPLLPVVIGSSLGRRSALTPYVVIGSLCLSIVVFTFVLKVSTVFITIPPSFWSFISGSIVAFFGLTLLFPKLWGSVPFVKNVNRAANAQLGTGYQKKSIWGDVLMGSALGPVFSTCSPTYFLILATVLPASLLLGTVYLLSFVAGLALILLLIVRFGDVFVGRLLTASASYEKVKGVIGGVLLIVGLSIAFGLDKDFESYLLEKGYINPTQLEYSLLQRFVPENPQTESTPVVSETERGDAPQELPSVPPVTEDTSPATLSTPDTQNEIPETVSELPVEQKPIPAVATKKPERETLATESYRELVSPDAYLNTDGEEITIKEALKNHKAVLVTFITYSCINCQRTFSYLKSWHEKYSDEGLLIIGIHTPEFAYEKNVKNVEAALKKEGLEFPVVLDNDYKSWNAYGNRYWPRRYLIGPSGTIIFDHIGEGAYEETEALIKQLINR
jgi:cytochrome c biogenesis protein CcdA/peroxiredoxin